MKGLSFSWFELLEILDTKLISIVQPAIRPNYCPAWFIWLDERRIVNHLSHHRTHGLIRIKGPAFTPNQLRNSKQLFFSFNRSQLPETVSLLSQESASTALLQQYLMLSQCLPGQLIGIVCVSSENSFLRHCLHKSEYFLVIVSSSGLTEGQLTILWFRVRFWLFRLSLNFISFA